MAGTPGNEENDAMGRDSDATGRQGDTDSEADDTASGDPYIHRPEGAEPLTTDTPTEKREFGWDGWALVVGIVIAFLIVPALIYWRPPALPFEVAFLILPLLPAVLLALLAVWVTTTT
ncbi:MAG: hypothetical protein ABEH65_12000 [Halobacteriales archaeon]